MWKYHRKKSHKAAIAAAVILLCVSDVSVAGESCLYKKQIEVRPNGVAAEIRKSEFIGYLLVNGAYLRVDSWSCSRFGKRLLLIVPQNDDSADAVAKVVLPLVDEALSNWLKVSITSSFGMDNYEDATEVKGYESAQIAVRRDLFSATYTIEYYTPD